MYSHKSMPDTDFILRKSEISDRLKNINAQLGLITQNPDSLLSDEEFIKQASHLLIQKELKGRKYIYYKNLATSVDPEILRTYMETILDSMYIIDGRISSIVFKNGLTHKFIYKN